MTIDEHAIVARIDRDRRARAGARARAALGLLLIALALPALAQEAPDALVKRVSQEALQIIKTDPNVQAGDPSRIRELIETKLTPHFDIDRMTALAAGRAYRSATPEQKKRLGEEFKTLLIRTYSSALRQYREQTIDYKPLRADPGATDVVVRTEVIRPGQPPVQIDYSMGKTPDGWKAYDVVVGGVSLVTNYRDEFTQQVQAGGVDGLIKSLAAKNAGLGEVIDDPKAPAARGGVFSAVETGWSFGGALTLDDAADVLDASKALPLPATGLVDFGGLIQYDSAALAVMLALKRRAVAEDRTLTLTGMPASLRSLAVVYGVDHYLADAAS